MPILVTPQEANTEVFKNLPVDERVEDKEVKVCDYLIQSDNGQDVLVERKEIADFFASIVDGRIWTQLQEMSAHDAVAKYLVLEGEFLFEPSLRGKQSRSYVPLTEYFRDYHPEKELSFYNTVAAIGSFGVRFVWTKDAAGTALFITKKYESLGKTKSRRAPPLRSGFKKDWPLEKKRIYLAEAFGQALAEALVASGTLKEIMDVKLTREEMKERLPKTYMSGRKIPSKEIDEVLNVLGLVQAAASQDQSGS